MRGVGLAGLGQQLRHQIPLAVHHRHDLRAGQVGPVGGDDGGGGVLFAEQRHGLGDFFLAGGAGAAENDAGGMAHLIVIELTKVLHIQPDLVHVGHRHKAVQLHRQRLGHALHGAGHIAELAHAGRLDEDAVGVIGVHHLLERLPEIPHQRAADAAGVQLVHLHTGLAHEAAVNADLTEFVFDEHQLFPGKGLLNQLFDERGLASAQKSGKNINFGLIHNLNLPCITNLL